MKKIKALLAATAIFAVVGGSLAFRPQSNVFFCTESESGSGVCDQVTGFRNTNSTTFTPVKPLVNGQCPSSACTTTTSLIFE